MLMKQFVSADGLKGVNMPEQSSDRIRQMKRMVRAYELLKDRPEAADAELVKTFAEMVGEGILQIPRSATPESARDAIDFWIAAYQDSEG